MRTKITDAEKSTLCKPEVSSHLKKYWKVFATSVDFALLLKEHGFDEDEVLPHVFLEVKKDTPYIGTRKVANLIGTTIEELNLLFAKLFVTLPNSTVVPTRDNGGLKGCGN